MTPTIQHALVELFAQEVAVRQSAMLLLQPPTEVDLDQLPEYVGGRSGSHHQVELVNLLRKRRCR